jgi:hypothetical protein
MASNSMQKDALSSHGRRKPKQHGQNSEVFIYPRQFLKSKTDITISQRALGTKTERRSQHLMKFFRQRKGLSGDIFHDSFYHWSLCSAFGSIDSNCVVRSDDSFEDDDFRRARSILDPREINRGLPGDSERFLTCCGGTQMPLGRQLLSRAFDMEAITARALSPVISITHDHIYRYAIHQNWFTS